MHLFKFVWHNVELNLHYELKKILICCFQNQWFIKIKEVSDRINIWHIQKWNVVHEYS